MQDFKGVEIYFPNKGRAQSRTTRNWWENICPSQQKKKCWGESFSSCFSCSTQNGTGLGGEDFGVGGQDRVSSPHANQEILRPTCHIQLHPWLQSSDGYHYRQAG